MMRGKYYINITLSFLTMISTCIMYQHNYKYIYIYALSVHYVPLIIYVVVVQMN